MTRHTLHSHITEIKKQKYEDLSNQRHSAARRKSKILKVYQTAMEKIQKGEIVDLTTLPIVSPAKRPPIRPHITDSPACTNQVGVLNCF